MSLIRSDEQNPMGRKKVELKDLRGMEVIDAYMDLPGNFTGVTIKDRNGFVVTDDYSKTGATPYDNLPVIEAYTYAGEDDLTIIVDYTADCPFPEYIVDACTREEGCTEEHIMAGLITRKRILDAWLLDCGMGGQTEQIIEAIADIYGIRLTDNGYEVEI